jgi:hypothetical protein
MFPRDLSDDRPDEMDVTHLPAGSGKGSFHRTLDPPVTIGDHQIHLLQTPIP